ncbi:hypothetical protein ACS4JF_27505 [Bacillus thuringiensis]|uniref:hypothetical protein n=1 Tax=Bacillus thuringiensis TaxID=1428 RepID=UPI001FAC4105|nr:hypothetical protein [Bacillus thuringiensis]MDM8365044.1 hypothetical protein [Bacillus thuringiensis]
MFKCLILEDNFCFRKDDSLLNYKDINLEALKDIEVLTGLMSEQIIIVHESISTAAELGLFSGNKFIAQKILLLTPDYYGVEEEFISGFIKLAFNNEFFPKYNMENIVYYPRVKKIKISENKSKYHTYFVGNEIPINLQTKLLPKLRNEPLKIIFKKVELKQEKKEGHVYYEIVNGKGNVFLTPKVLISLLMSIISIDVIKRKLRAARSIRYFTNELDREFKKIMMETLKNESGIESIEKFDLKILGIDVVQKVAISYFVYVLKGIDFIEIPKNDGETLTMRTEFLGAISKYSSAVGRLESNLGVLDS